MSHNVLDVVRQAWAGAMKSVLGSVEAEGRSYVLKQWSSRAVKYTRD